MAEQKYQTYIKLKTMRAKVLPGKCLVHILLAALAICGVTTLFLHKMALRTESYHDFNEANDAVPLYEQYRRHGRPPRNLDEADDAAAPSNENNDNVHDASFEEMHKSRRHRKLFSHQYELRDKYDKLFPRWNTKRMTDFARSQRKRKYEPISNVSSAAALSVSYDVFNCPLFPPEGYPMQWNLLDIVDNWNPDDTEPREKIYQGICVFDHGSELEKAKNYRKKEVPFILRDDPEVLQATERWAQPEYLRELLAPISLQRTEYNSAGNHFMYWHKPRVRLEGWKPPTENIKMSYSEWISKANAPDEDLAVDKPHWYFRLNGAICEKKAEDCADSNEFLYDELSFFKPEKSFYMVDPYGHRGINCRFGMKGVIAENHFDGSRNFIVLMGGERRYVLAHPSQCQNLCLYPKNHPSGRHSAVDWSDPDLEKFPQFRNAMANEIVLQAGDALYLPTFWFHYIINLGVNFQCNARSGSTSDYNKVIRKCGF